MSLPEELPEVPESEKPFYLALFSGIFVLLLMVLGFVGAYQEKQTVLEYLDKLLAPIFALIGAAWAFYFGTKKT